MRARNIMLYGGELKFVVRACVMIAASCLFMAASNADAKDLRVKVDQAYLVKLEEPGAEVIVGNPTIADVTVRNSKLLVVTGKSYGSTNVIVLDKDGEEILHSKISVSAEDWRVVTLRKGVMRYSLHCTPVCQTSLTVGDETNYFNDVNQATIGKFSAANAVIKGSSR